VELIWSLLGKIKGNSQRGKTKDSEIQLRLDQNVGAGGLIAEIDEVTVVL